MKNAIVYRANETLDAKLLGLKDKVDFFIRINPEDLPGDDYEAGEKIEEIIKSCTGTEKEIFFFTDITCAPSVQQGFYRAEMNIMCQEDGQLEAYVAMIAEEGKPVIIVLENLADHVNVDGADPYEMSTQDSEVGGWYHTKVLSIWENILTSKGTDYRVVSVKEILGTSLDSYLVICDHHCTNRNYEISEKSGWRNAYRANPCKVIKLEDIPIY